MDTLHLVYKNDVPLHDQQSDNGFFVEDIAWLAVLLCMLLLLLAWLFVFSTN